MQASSIHKLSLALQNQTPFSLPFDQPTITMLRHCSIFKHGSLCCCSCLLLLLLLLQTLSQKPFNPISHSSPPCPNPGGPTVPTFKTAPLPSEEKQTPLISLPSLVQKTAFYGLSLLEVKRVSFIAGTKRCGGRNGVVGGRRGLEVSARTAGASKNIEVEVDKPLGLTLGQKSGGGVIITAVDSGGNAAKAGLKSGDQVLYTSSFFGDELWPADKLGFTKTAIQAKPDSIYFVVSRGAEVDVKRLPKRPAPPRFGRTLTEAQKARATHICLDCGFIYTLPKPFDEQPDTYGCPQCSAPKKRFARYDVSSGKPIGGGLPPIGVIVGLVAGIAAIGALLAYGLQ